MLDKHVSDSEGSIDLFDYCTVKIFKSCQKVLFFD